MRSDMLSLLMLAILVSAADAVGDDPPQRTVDRAAIAHLAASEQELIDDYASKWPRLFSFYTNLSLEGGFRGEKRGTDDSALSVASDYRGTVQILRNKYFRLTGFRADGAEWGTAIVTPDESYSLEWNAEKHRHVLVGRMKTKSELFNRLLARYPPMHVEAFAGDEFHAAVFGLPIGPGRAHIEGIERGRDGDDEVAIATVLCSGNDNGRDWCRIRRFTFLRNRCWATRSQLSAIQNVEQRQYNIESTRCEYDGDVDGVPLLKRCTKETGLASFSDATVDRCRIYDPGEITILERNGAIVDKIVPGAPDESVFDVKPYLASMGGLGDVREPARYGFALLLSSLGLLFLGVFLYKGTQRSRTNGSSP